MPRDVPRKIAVRVFAAAAILAAPAAAAGPDEITRGEYLAAAAGCADCHTDTKNGGRPYAGGRPLTTPFGTFYAPNITPDPETGIGRWSNAQFLNALREGVRPDGSSYFPVFPYPSFTKITDEDARAISSGLTGPAGAANMAAAAKTLTAILRGTSRDTRCRC